MTKDTPNPESEVINTEEAETTQQDTPNEDGTEQKETVETEQENTHEVETVDYRAKFVESSKGAHALLEQNKKLKQELSEAKKGNSPDGNIENLPNHSSEPTNQNLYPGFEDLDKSEQQRVSAFAESVRKAALVDIQSNPALAFAEKQYNETRWEEAFSVATVKFPDLSEIKTEFKSKYFHPNHVPDNIEDIIETMAKAELYDKAHKIGAEEAVQQQERVQLEDPTGGDKDAQPTRTLADWQQIAASNPAKFAELKDQYEADVRSGKLKE